MSGFFVAEGCLALVVLVTLLIPLVYKRTSRPFISISLNFIRPEQSICGRGITTHSRLVLFNQVIKVMCLRARSKTAGPRLGSIALKIGLYLHDDVA